MINNAAIIVKGLEIVFYVFVIFNEVLAGMLYIPVRNRLLRRARGNIANICLIHWQCFKQTLPIINLNLTEI